MGPGALVAAAAAFWVGIAVAGTGEAQLGRAWGLAQVAVGMAALAVVAVAGGRQPSARIRLPSLAACAMAFALLGSGWAAVREAALLDSPLARWSGRSVRVLATLTRPPAASGIGWSGAIDVAALQVSPVTGEAIAVRRPVWIQGRPPPPSLERGDQVLVEGTLRAPSRDFGRFLVTRGYAASQSVRRIERVGDPGLIQRAANVVRGALRDSLEEVLPAREAALVMGLAIGDTSRMPATLQEQFRATGLSHLTAVSGANVAMFLAPLLALMTILPVGRWGRLVAALAAMGFFVVLTGAEPSVLRASAMMSITLLGVFLGRRGGGAAALAGAVVALLALNPTLVHSVGFQLSVAATAGMVLAAGAVAERLRILPRSVALAVGATVGAQAGVTPLLLYHFGAVPTTTLPANLLAFPAVSPAMLLGLAAGLANLAWHPAGIVVAGAARLPLAWIAGVASRLARAPLPVLTSTPGRWAPLVVGVAVVGAAGWWIRSHRRLPAPAVGALAMVVPLVLWMGAIRAGPPGELTVTFFDVGQGDAALVRSPAGASILVDAGPEEDDVAQRLSALGVKRIDLLVASHAHENHVEGLPAVLARFPVALVVEPGCRADSPSYARFVDALAASGAPVHHPRQGAVLVVGDLRVEVLGPDRCYRGTDSDANNDSLVLRVRLGEAAVLFAGDAEEPAQEDILEDLPDRLRASVLKVPHHGGATSIPAFLTATGARVAVVSSGEDNRFGHPAPSIVRTLQFAGMLVLRTDALGDVTVSVGEEGAHIESSGD